MSNPQGVLVVPDCVTHFLDDYLIINDEGVDEPLITEAKSQQVELIDSDGYGLMLPSRAMMWSRDIGGELYSQWYVYPECVDEGDAFYI